MEMKTALRWLFSPPPEPVEPWDALAWWELRRIPFNLIVGVYGVVCLAIFLAAISTSGRLHPGEDAVEPLALLAAPFVINALYTLGWLVEVPLRLFSRNTPPRLGPALLKLGLSFGLALITLPAAVWTGIRLLQLGGIVQ
jgi:hypothetical protein